ncbi:MAG: hypothetical protein ABIJ33_03980 [Patescibacteria group bacterium]
MKKYSSYVLPAVIVLFAFSLIFRWAKGRQLADQSLSEYGEGIKIEDLTAGELSDVIKGVGDFETVELEQSPEVAETLGTGMIRYEIKDDKVKLSVLANLAKPEASLYQVWLRTLDDSTLQRIFILEENKGGYMGSAAVPAEFLPFEVIVSREQQTDSKLEAVILRGTIPAQLTE